MKKQSIKLELEVEFLTPFHIGSGLGAGKLIDNLVLVDREGFPYIPGSTIKGRVKANLIRIVNTLKSELDWLEEQEFCTGVGEEICKNLAPEDNCLICRLFGSSFTPGAILFPDLHLLNQELLDLIKENGGVNNFKEHLISIRNANRLDRRLKTSKSGALFNYEVATNQYQYGGEIRGKAYLSAAELELFKNSFSLITHLGASKSRGLGRCEIKIN